MLRRASNAIAVAAAVPSDASTLHRRRRVAWMIFAIAILSLADLYFTLLYARTIGMSEANPVARLVMSFNSPVLLGLWKCATVALACLIFWAFSHRKVTECAAWGCMSVLAALTVWWSIYSREIPHYAANLHTIAQSEANWVQMTD